MNKEIQQYLQNNNATIRFENNKIIVNRVYKDTVGLLVDRYNSFDDLFEGVKWESYKSTLKLQVEISGRQTGKTSRLIDAMGDHIKNGGICFLYCVSQDMGRGIINKLIELFGGDYIRSSIFINPSNITISKIKSEDLLRMRPFYDEFDFLKPEHQTYNEIGYYCTSPSKLRDMMEFYKLLGWRYFQDNYDKSDLLIKLILRTNFNFEKRMNYELMKKFGADYPKEKLRIESGEIFK